MENNTIVVWVAKRDKPLVNHGRSVTFNNDGSGTLINLRQEEVFYIWTLNSSS